MLFLVVSIIVRVFLTEKRVFGCNSVALEGDLSSIVSGLHLKAALKCAESKIPDSAMQKIEEALSKTEDPISQLLALVATSKIAAKGVEKTKVDEAVKDLLDHLSNDGFKVHEDLENGSGYYTALLLDSVASLKSVMSKEVKDSVSSSAVDSLKSYLSSSAVQDESTLAYPHQDASVSDYVSTATLLDSLIKFNKAFSTKLGFNDEKLNKLARFFLSHSHIASLEEAKAVLTGLNALNAGTWRKPLIVTATQTTLKAATVKGEESQSIKFQITDVFGAAPGQQPKLFLVSLTSSESTTPLITNQELTQPGATEEKKSASGLFEFNLLAIKPAPGSYKLSLSVTPSKVTEGPQPYAAIKLTTRLVKVISSIELSDLTLSVRKSKTGDSSDDASSSSSSKHTFTYGAKPAKLEVSSDDVLDFSFVVKSKHSNKHVTVQQAFVLLVQGDSELFFVAKYDGAKKAYTVSAPLAKHIARFGSGGKFHVKLLVGDSYIDNSISWDVATMDVKLTEAAAQKISAAAAAASDKKQTSSVSSYKPQIMHKFRLADKRANAYISRLFTAITLAPLAIFVLGVLFVKLNFGNCPSGMGIIWVFLFHGSILLVVYAIYLFFVRNNLFQTLQLLLYFVPVVFFTGLHALRAVAKKRAQNLEQLKDPQNH